MRCSKLFTILWVLGSTWHGLVTRRFSFSLSPFHFVLHSTARMGGREFHSLIWCGSFRFALCKWRKSTVVSLGSWGLKPMETCLSYVGMDWWWVIKFKARNIACRQLGPFVMDCMKIYIVAVEAKSSQNVFVGPETLGANINRNEILRCTMTRAPLRNFDGAHWPANFA